MQHKVRSLEKQLQDLERDETEPDAEDVMRGAASVRVQDTDESKFLGPSSGITITRLVMQLAKQFTDSKSISEIVPDASAKSIKATFVQEDARPTSKVYPLVSDVAADELPNRDLTNLLLELFYCKVHPMYVTPGHQAVSRQSTDLVPQRYPMFHEPTLTKDVEQVYSGSTDPYQNFCLRMVIAISLQRMDTQYAGLADSYYLAALKFFESAIKPMNLRTLQCFALIAGYSLLTPTRTAVYYIVGLGVRLCQALGLHEEKTIALGPGGRPADPLEVDMRRRLFWSILSMEYGLSHSLGRPSHFAARCEHIDVKFGELVDDVSISKNGILPDAQPSLKKWIGIHFFKLRILQLEIRRKLYQSKRPEPKNDQDPWFADIQARIERWRDTSPEVDGNSGLDKVWFIGRYNTMVCFLYRPSPQIPRPSARAAVLCYDACEYNIYMTRKQIETKSVDVTWIFTQAIFMAVNVMLWSLSYSEVRANHSRDEVERHLLVALESIELASERWPGVASALQLYHNLIGACMKIYDKDGDIPIAAASPSDSASVVSHTIDGVNRSRATSPATASTASVSTPSEATQPAFGHLPVNQKPQQSMFNFNSSQQGIPISKPGMTSHAQAAPDHYSQQQAATRPFVDASSQHIANGNDNPNNIPSFGYPQPSQFTSLPATFADLSQWSPAFSMPNQEPFSMQNQPLTSPIYNENYAANQGYAMTDYLYPQWGQDYKGHGLNQEQHMQLMQDFEANETGKIEEMIQQSHQLFRPHAERY